MGPCLFYRTLFEMCRVWWQLPLLGTRQDFFICFDCCFIWSRSFVTRRRNVLGHFSDASRRHRRGWSSLLSSMHRRSSEKPCPTAKKLASLTDGESGGSPPSRSTDLFDHFCCQLEKIIDFANVRQKNICAFSKFSFVAFEDQK